ncbi:MAG: hypothetical protein GVY19_10470 [Bacteroidetes bacterium]|jgi:hypothetical protein|nr:hypothetical protein [Bacteroidota bacterium]
MTVFIACNPTKRVGQHEYLLDDVKISSDNKKIDRDELYPYVMQKPNKRVFGSRFHLAVYNLASPGKENNFNNWLRKIGEEPVIYDPLLQDRTKKQFQLFLRNKGYFNASISDTVIKKHQQATIRYNIITNEPYYIKSIDYNVQDTTIRDKVLSDTVNSVIKPGSIFDLNLLNQERIRIETNLNNQGYYNFIRQYISYEADTNKGGNKVDLDIYIEDSNTSGNEIIPHRKYYLNDIYIHSDYDRQLYFSNKNQYLDKLDTILIDTGIFYLYNNEIKLKPNAASRYNYLFPGNAYRRDDVDKSYRFYSSLPIIKSVNIKFSENHTDTTVKNILDGNIYLSQQKKQSFSVDGEVTFSEGDLGGGGSFNYKNKNLFRGAETFNLKLLGRIENFRKREIYPTQVLLQEYGVESNIEFPVFLLPFRTEKFERKFNPKTQISTSYNYQKDGYMTRNISNFSIGYNWKGNNYNRHIVKPFDLYYVNLIDTSAGFTAEVVSNYADPSSYTTHLVSATSYSFIYSNQQLNTLKDFVYIRYNVETAGNLLSLYYNTFRKNDSIVQRQFLNNIYAQYIKSDVDFRYYQQIDAENTIVYRLFAGFGGPYGNSQSLPIEKQYFGGGSTNRGWSPYRLAPDSSTLAGNGGRYRGDIKLEANIEYRFDLPWIVEGALFSDVGNVWNFRSLTAENNESLAEATFAGNKFYNQLAISGGLGLRIDLNFFVFRIDFALRLIDPLINTGSKWAPGYGAYKFRDITNFDLGIGYPF